MNIKTKAPLHAARLFYGPILVGAKRAFDVRISAQSFREALNLEYRRASILGATYDLEQREAIDIEIAKVKGEIRHAEEVYMQTYRRVAKRLGLPTKLIDESVEVPENEPSEPDVAPPSN